MIAPQELEILLVVIQEQYGYDFTQYSRASLQRRIDHFCTTHKLKNFNDFLQLLQNPEYFTQLINELTVNVTEMFRDANFYNTLRKSVLPVLATYPFIRIWHAGCSTGEEVYSLAILLKEAGILHKSLLYATDINPLVIEQAKNGIFPARMMQLYSENYQLGGGKADFSDYYISNYNVAKFHESLKERMVFSTHNLVSDKSFNVFQLVLCRNVLIYFDKDLQNRVLQLFDKSLDNLGFLGLGNKESIRFSAIAFKYLPINTTEKIWRKNTRFQRLS